MSEAYMITIYRRNGKLFVSPAVGSTLGFENLPGVIAVGGREELVPKRRTHRSRLRGGAQRRSGSRRAPSTSWPQARRRGRTSCAALSL